MITHGNSFWGMPNHNVGIVRCLPLQLCPQQIFISNKRESTVCVFLRHEKSAFNNLNRSEVSAHGIHGN